MPTWERSGVTTLCGNCPTQIAVGDPILVYRGQTWRKIRCRTCADTPVPRDLPPLAVRATVLEPEPVPIQSLIHALPLDWRTRQVGREPGDDDE